MAETETLTREQAAREQIQRRREAAEKASPSGANPDGWYSFQWDDGDQGNARIYCGPTCNGYREGEVFGFSEDCEECSPPSAADLWHITIAADPEHVLAVLDAAEATLERHGQRSVVVGPGQVRLACAHCDLTLWPCPDAVGVLDVYAPSGSGRYES